MIIAGTGHRPQKLGGYDQKTRRAVGALAAEYLHETQPERVISGMAQGWDQALAAAAIICGIPLIAAVPFEGFERRWPAEAQGRFERILERAEKVEILGIGDLVGREVDQALQARNEWMVDRCDRLAALWDGSWGGTFNTLQYAQRCGRAVDNLWSRWSEPADIRELLG